MNEVEQINKLLESLPPTMKEEALDFVEFLSKKAKDRGSDEMSDLDWSNFSIENALRDEPDDTIEYFESDLKVSWR